MVGSYPPYNTLCMFLKRWLILLLLLSPISLLAQVDEAIEDWLQEDGSEDVAAEMNDILKQYMAAPVNINDSAAVAELPFVSPFQLKALRNYITLHGQLLSMKELAFVPGFDSVTYSLLMFTAKAEPYVNDGKWRWWEGRHTVVTGIGGTVEQAAGYRDSTYSGDNLRALISYNYNYRNHINVRLVADKDPAEPWGKGNYYGYHLMLSDIGRLERLVVGRYNLQFGQGLTLWTGLAPFNFLGQPTIRFGSGVRQASAFYEYGYQEGVAATVNIGAGVHLSAFASRVDGETLLGGHVDYRRGNLIVGLTGSFASLGSLNTVRDYVYNQNYFRGDRLANFGVDAVYRYRRLMLYGEASLSSEGKPAAIAGATIEVSGTTAFGVSYRYYDPLYHNLHAQGYAIGTIQGEKGLAFEARTTLPLGLLLVASADMHDFPVLRYGAYSPTSGSWLRFRLERGFGRYLHAVVRYAYRQKERNIPNIDSTLYLNEKTVRHQVQSELASEIGNFRLVSRGAYAIFETDNNEIQHGWLVSQSARYMHGPIQVTAALTWFNVDGYYARLYLSESNLQYAWSMPMLNGRGMRGSAVLRYDVCRWLAAAIKYAVLYYPGQESVGSGAAQTEGPLRQTWFIQLRCKF